MKRPTKIRIRYPRGSGAFYPATLPLSSQALAYVAGVIRRHRAQIKLNAGRQALLVIAVRWPSAETRLLHNMPPDFHFG